MKANKKLNEPEDEKIASFLWLAGTRAADIFNTLFPNDGTTDGILGVVVPAADNQNAALMYRKLDDVMEAFDDYCVPRKNVAMESFKFNTIVQKEKQLFADFETELRKQLQYCEFV